MDSAISIFVGQVLSFAAWLLLTFHLATKVESVEGLSRWRRALAHFPPFSLMDAWKHKRRIAALGWVALGIAYTALRAAI